MISTLYWRELASCRDYDPELWFPLGNVWTPKQANRAAAAKAICAGCPVRAECLNDALRRGDVWAILGETTPDERRTLAAKSRARDAGMARVS